MSSSITSNISSPFLAPMSDILFKDFDIIFVYLFTILLIGCIAAIVFSLNSFNAARDLAREFRPIRCRDFHIDSRSIRIDTRSTVLVRGQLY